MRSLFTRSVGAALVSQLLWAPAAPAQVPHPPALAGADTVAGVADDEYVIGADDVLSIVFWRDKDLSGDVVVRPDGRISLPLINDIAAAGLTPSGLRARLATEAKRFIDDPTVTVVVRQINSRKVYVTGNVARPGAYPLTSGMTVLQGLALAGGLTDYADAKNIVVMRSDHGQTMPLRFNYREVSEGRGLAQNRELSPGDTIVVR